MKLPIRILALLLVLVMAFGIVACNGGGSTDDPKNDPGTQEDPGKENEEKEEDPTVEELLLVEKKKATFSVVYTAKSGNKAKELADGLAALLQQVEASENDAVADTAADKVADVEVVIGCDPQNRGTKPLADHTTVGLNDWKVELVGKRVLIYGGCDDALQKAYDYFVGSVLKLKTGATTISKTVKIEAATFGKSYQQVEQITVNGEDLNGFTVVYDELASNWYEQKTAAEALQRAFSEYAGIALKIETASNNKATARLVKIVKTDEAGETGFRIRPDGKNLLIEYRYENTFVRSVNDFIANKVATFKGKVEMTAHTEYAEHGDYLYYEDFGAKGDGKANDFIALYNTHVEANKTGQTVCANDDATYYIGTQDNGAEIPVMTDTNWGKAHFIIDDTSFAWNKRHSNGINARNLDIFHLMPTYETITYTKEEIRALNGGEDVVLHPKDKVFAIQDKSLFQGADCLITPYYSGHKIFIRYGTNSSAGEDTHEILRVDKDGNIGYNTFVEFDYPTVDKLTVLRVDETPITIDGGIFTTWANNAPREYTYYNRGIMINRSNSTIINLEHYIEKEFETGAPYSGFLFVQNVNKVLMKDCKVSGHKLYWLSDNPNNGMGTYDLGGNVANDITWNNVTQINSIINQDYWGVHGTNYCKNFTMKNCYLSRIDAHSGMFNATIIDTTLGQFCNCIGGGKLYMKNVIRSSGPEFIQLRFDYGATWHGDAEIIDCAMYGYKRAYGNVLETVENSAFQLFNGSFVDHDFGYETYLPQNVTLENFQCGKNGDGTLTLFFLSRVDKTRNEHSTYNIPKTVTIRGLKAKSWELCNFMESFDFASVKVTEEPGV